VVHLISACTRKHCSAWEHVFKLSPFLPSLFPLSIQGDGFLSSLACGGSWLSFQDLPAMEGKFSILIKIINKNKYKLRFSLSRELLV